MPMRILSAAVFLLLIATSAWAGAVKRKEPGPKAKGKVYEWAAKNGLVYYYYVPK